PAGGLALKALLITLICQVCLHYSDLYTPDSHPTAAEVLARMLQALGIASLVLALVYWLLPQTRLSTGLVVGAVLAVLLILLGWRRAMDLAMRWAQRAYPVGERLLVLGAGERARALVHELQQHPQLGLELIGVVSEEPAAMDELAIGPGAKAVDVLGSLEQTAAIIAAKAPRRIALALEERRCQLPTEALVTARLAGIRIEEAPTLMERITGRVALANIRPSWLILSDGFCKSRWLRFYQRGSSIAAALIGLVLLIPVLVLVAIAIKLESRGPVIYRQTRVGKGGREFEIFKFRSMRADAESGTGPTFAQERDSRVTRVGAWLRKLRLDEVPQLFNVLRGEMALVGPRPERPGFVQDFRRAIPYYEMRHSVRPGITGWAQVSRDYGASLDDAREKLEFDLFYIKNLSAWLDLFIIFQTTKIIALGRGAR
ncbi:MAG: TIGR03013 family XrtA/PEP-CTERM system glycosyltransferase, partial [Terriglobales bacterium]